MNESLSTTAARIVPQVLPICGEHQIGEARRAAAAMLHALGFQGPAVNYAVTAVSELAANLVFHARCQQVMTLRPLRVGSCTAFEIVAEDGGPGIDSLVDAMRDGFSTNGGLGAGLPGVRRLMDEFEIRSKPGVGTTVVARKWLR